MARKYRHAVGDYSQPDDLVKSDAGGEDDLTPDETGSSGNSIVKEGRGHSISDSTEQSDVEYPNFSLGPMQKSSSTNSERRDLKRKECFSASKGSRSHASKEAIKKDSPARTSSTTTFDVHARLSPKETADDEVQLIQQKVTLTTTIKTSLSLDEYAKVYRKAWERLKVEESPRSRLKSLRTSYFGAWEMALVEHEEAKEAARIASRFDKKGTRREGEWGPINDAHSNPLDIALFQDQVESLPPGSAPTLDGYAPWQQTRQTSLDCQSRNSGQVVEESQDAYDFPQIDGHDSINASRRASLSEKTKCKPSVESVTTVSPQELRLNWNSEAEQGRHSSVEKDDRLSSVLRQSFREDSSDHDSSTLTSSTNSIAHQDAPTQPSDYKFHHEAIYREGKENHKLQRDGQQSLTPTSRTASQSSKDFHRLYRARSISVSDG